MLLKLLAAFRTADHDPALSFWNTDLLSALRAFIDMVAGVSLSLLCILAKPPAKVLHPARERTHPVSEGTAEAAVPDLSGDFQIFAVLVIALCNVAREHPEIHINQENQGKPPQERISENQLQNDKNQNNAGKELTEFVCPVPPLHELHKFVTKPIEHRK